MMSISNSNYIIKPKNNKFRVISDNLENMGTFDTIKEAQNRIQELTKISLYKIAKEHKVDFTYSATIRFLRKEYPDKVRHFLEQFKKTFDQACVNQDLQEDPDNLEKVCLMETVKKLGNL